jgi:hypothetical protein
MKSLHQDFVKAKIHVTRDTFLKVLKEHKTLTLRNIVLERQNRIK